MSNPVSKDAVSPSAVSSAGESQGHSSRNFGVLALGSIGVVFGDIGTSPLYALKTALGQLDEGALGPPQVIGVVSLIIWALLLVVTGKYVLFLMQADNKGEGGTLSLVALAQNALGRRTTIVFLLGVAGSALFSGDAIITPAISVLSALEGLKQVDADLARYVLPATIVILVVLFTAQSRGTARVAAFFSPIMVTFFAVNAILGLTHIASAWIILEALSPIPGLLFIHAHGLIGFIVLGSVFLAVTGAEALYADMGHFGRRPIQAAWLFFVLPALVCNYLGQGALIITNPNAVANPFYLMAPAWALVPLILLSTAATVIASQAVITGAFSLTSQAIQLGLLPRLEIVHTSSTQEGQIFIPRVNRIILVGVLALVLLFRTSEALGNAYGIAVAGTMVVDTSLAFFVVWKLWRWSIWAAAALAGGFLVIDVGFFVANLYKVVDGGWVPLTLGTAMFMLMWTWSRGSAILLARTHRELDPDAGPDQDAREVEAGAGPGNIGFPHQRSHIGPVVADAQSQAQQGAARARRAFERPQRDDPAGAPRQPLRNEELVAGFHAGHASFRLYGATAHPTGVGGDAEGRTQVRHHDDVVLPGAAHVENSAQLRHAPVAGQTVHRDDETGGERARLLQLALRSRR